jgi:GMP reductase
MHRFDLDGVAFARRMREAGLYVSLSAGRAGGRLRHRATAWRPKDWGPTTSPSTSRTATPTAVQRQIAHIKQQLPAAFVIAGNVGTPEAVIDLERWGADATKVGIGPGKVCITQHEDRLRHRRLAV